MHAVHTKKPGLVYTNDIPDLVGEYKEQKEQRWAQGKTQSWKEAQQRKKTVIGGKCA